MELPVNKILSLFVKEFKYFIKNYLIKNKYQRQIENSDDLQKKMDEMSKEKIKRWKNENRQK